MTRPLRILIVDDSADDAHLLLDCLRNGGFDTVHQQVETAESLRQALERQSWDVVVSDHSMPHFSSSAALEVVRGHEKDLPFIIVSGTISERDAVDAMRNGAQDYLLKDSLARLPGAIAREMEESANRRDWHAAEDRIRYLAHHDVPTGLKSRAWLLDRLMEAAGENKAQEITVLAIGLDRLNEVAQAFGQQYADAAMVEVAAGLEDDLSGGSVHLARLGDDQLGLCLRHPGSQRETSAMLAQVIATCGRDFMVDGHLLKLMPRIGVSSLLPGASADPVQTLRAAAMALEQARREDKLVGTFTSSLEEERKDRLRLLADLQQAIGRNEFWLAYQPQVDSLTGRLQRVEALIRWRHPTRGGVGPDMFIPLAESAGSMRPITEWVLRTAVAQQELWREQGQEVPIAINVSAHDLRDGSLAEDVQRTFDRAALDGRSFCFEVTESALVTDGWAAIQALARLNQLGSRTSIDDFGTGYSSLAYLRQLPVQELKIDRSFVQPAIDDDKAKAILKMVTQLGLSLGMDVVAEGVETQEMLELLRDLHCTTVQGYHICKPLPAAELSAWLHMPEHLAAA